MFKRTLTSATTYALVALVAACSPEGSTTSTGSGGTSGGSGTGGETGTGSGGSTGSGTGGSTGSGTGGSTGSGSGGSVGTGSGGSTGSGSGGSSSSGTGGSSGSGSGGSTGSGSGGGTGSGSGGSTGSGSGGSGSGGSTGTGSGGSTGTGTGGSNGTGSGGSTGSGGATGGAGTGSGGAPGTGGTTTPPVTQSSTCKIPTWPSAQGSQVNISGTKSVSGTYDGKMALHEGSGSDCSSGNQTEGQDPIIEVEDGGTVKNIVFGKKIGDGIHCKGSCTIDNVWFQYICDDAVTMLGGSGKTATIQNSGFKGARDKTIQHNGEGSTVVIKNVYVETAGKLYRSCGEGCSSSAKRTVQISDVVAIGVDQIAGVSTNDKATLANICAYRTPTLCRTYVPGSDTETVTGANSTSEGPSSACSYKGTDSHALVTKVQTAGLTTETLCPGPDSVKVGSSNATNCLTGFDPCLKTCGPGAYGFRQANCVSGKYVATGPTCALPSDTTIAANLDSSHAAAATNKVSNNSSCTSEWAWGTDGSGKYCVCVMKPGYYQQGSGWFVWDCQSQWW